MSLERDKFIHLLATYGVPLNVIQRVLRDSLKVQRYATRQCNMEITERQDNLWFAAQRRIKEALIPFCIAASTSGDPRGYVVKLRLPNCEHNTMGGAEAGYGVPTRRLTDYEAGLDAPRRGRALLKQHPDEVTR